MEECSEQLNVDMKISSDLDLDTKKDAAILRKPEVEEPVLVIENHSESYENLENENEVITIVTQENEEEIIIYEKNGSEDHPNEFIKVCGVHDDQSKEVEVTVDGDGDTVEVDHVEVNHEDHHIKVAEDGENEVHLKVDRESKVKHQEAGEEVNMLERDEMDGQVNVVENKEIDGERNMKIDENSKQIERSEVDSKDHIDENPDVVLDEKSGESNLKNYKNVILEDWEVEVPQIIGSREGENCTKKSHSTDTEKVAVNVKNGNEEKSKSSKDSRPQKSFNEGENSAIEKKIELLKIPKSITKNEIVKILDESTERVVRPIVPNKDLFFSIELTKRLNQKLSLNRPGLKTSEMIRNDEKNKGDLSINNNNNTTAVDDRQKIVEILEADEVKDWKSVPSKSDSQAKDVANDMEISKAIKNMEAKDTNRKTPIKTQRRSSKKIKIIDKEWERSIALQQLREEFPSTRKRSKTTKKVNHIPFLASTILEKALTSPEVSTALNPGPPKRRPCYLPENNANEHSKKGKEKPDKEGKHSGANASLEGIETTSKASTVVKTYSAKRKSTDTNEEIKSTIAAVTKALIESAEEASETKPKKQKTVMKSETKIKKKVLVRKKEKVKGGSGLEKKRNAELEKLLGDEGAVRMLYETQQEEAGTPVKKSKFKTTTGIKKDLMLKTKLVKNAVMRLSGMGADRVLLRGNRRSLRAKSSEISGQEEPLFASTPNIVLYKPMKKQRAEASRILYRHSSSESFDSSDGYRRTSIDADGLNGVKADDIAATAAETEKLSPKVKLKKAETFVRKRLRKKKEDGRVVKAKVDVAPSESAPTLGPKLNLSNVPVRKSSRPKKVSKKYSIWSSTSMDSLSVESLGLKKLKKASTKLGKQLNLKELSLFQYENFVQIVLAPVSTRLKNSLNLLTLRELFLVLNYLVSDDSCKVVLLSSQGSTFCQGVDVNNILSLDDEERKSEVANLVSAIREFIKCLAEFKKPVVAGVQAAAVGLGVTLLPYCDLVISSDTATYYTPYVKLGQVPEGAPTVTFPRLSRQLVSELLLKNVKMTAADALKNGLVTQIIPEERFEEELLLIARNIANQPTQGVQAVKFLLRSNNQEEIEETLRAESELLLEHWTSTECLGNILRFLNSGELQLKQLDNT